MNTPRFFQYPMVVPALILGAAFIAGAVIGASTFYAVRSFDHTLTVTGSAKTTATSDVAKWHFSISRRVTESTLPLGYRQLAADLTAVKQYLAEQNIIEEEVTIQPVMTEEIYRYDSSGINAPREFTVRQNISVESNDVAKVTAAAENIQRMAQQNVFVTANPPEYYYSQLADLRVSLLGEAIADAKARAQEIAGSSDSKVGRLQSASSGVVQVLAPNSIDVADYGQYDTRTIEKEVMVTVRAVFQVR